MTTPTIPPRLVRALETARRWAHPVIVRFEPVVFRVRRTWRRSLQLRMVTISVVVSGVLVSGFGFVVAERNNNALERSARDEAMRKLDAGAKYLQEQLSVQGSGEDPDIDETVEKNLIRLAASPEQGGDVLVVVKFSKAQGNVEPDVAWPRDDYDRNKAVITSDMERAVEAGNTASQVAATEGGDLFMVVGRPVFTPSRWSYTQVELYYAVPMKQMVDIANNTRVTMIMITTMLVLLLGVLVVTVTRQVASPVRLAAQTAQRLSAGLLDQRMTVKGEDELSLLADAFNQMAANLQRQIVRLEDMSRMQRRFTSDVSHELRTPLTTVRMAADLLHSQRDQFDPAVARSVELLQTELNRFEELLNDLLEISRFDAGFAMLEAEPIDLVALVRRVAERLTPVAQRAGTEITVTTPEPPVVAEVDSRRIERVLRNLVDNAIDHSEGKPVVITLGGDERAVAVTVRDYGTGLKPGEEKQVFNRFWRADPSRARQTGGTGLGLSISLEDARLHGGWLEAWGRPGKGAQFRLTLPVKAGARLASSPLPLASPTIPEQAEPAETEAVISL